MMKTKILKLLIFLALVTVQAQASVSTEFEQVREIVPIAAELAEHYHISDQQKLLMKSIVVAELPEAVLYAMGLLDNRQQLLAITASKGDYDEFAVKQLAHAQGELITELIIWKESLKKQLRSVLADDQQKFLDELIEHIIQKRVAAILQNEQVGLY